MTNQPNYRPMGGAQRRPVYARRPAALPVLDRTEQTHLRQAVLMTGCATALVLAACAASPGAQAQSAGVTAFQGTAQLVTGSANITRGATDVITVNSSKVVIDWTPSDTNGTGTIDFLPLGRTAQFRDGVSSGLSDYTVLNRILPVNGAGVPVSRVVALNGAVQSILGQGTGGSVWFYSPGGILAGANSTFNVGGLLLTTDAIDITRPFGGNNTISFQGATGSNAAVQILSGAQINASSYVAMVAPRVVQGGSVSAGGPVAYIGAEAADVTINGGLFDIAISAGTTDANGVVHTGTTGGAASTGFTDQQRIYMVAVPKNNALTMLLSGTIGYTAASAATFDGSAVVLAAGYDIGTSVGQEVRTVNTTGTGAAGVQLGSGTWRNDLETVATGDIVIRPNFSGLTDFSGNLTLSAGRSITLESAQQTTIRAAKNITLNAGSGLTGGTINLYATGGSGYPGISNGLIDVTGDLALNVSVRVDEGSRVTPVNGESAFAGTVNVIATGGLIQAANLDVLATATSGGGTQSSGDAAGGFVTLATRNSPGPIGTEGGTLRFGTTNIDASGDAPFILSQAPVNGGDVTGGTIRIEGTDGVVGAGTLDLGIVAVKAQATGGVASTGAAGDATGGNIILNITGGSHQFTSLNADVTVAAGHASDNGTFGSANRGATGLLIDISGPGSLAITESVSLYADANGQGGGVSGGALRAGEIRVLPHDGGTFTIARDLYASASSYATAYSSYSQIATTPDTIGGSVTVGAAGGTFSAAGINVYASASAANSPGRSGDATGGDITLYASASNGNRGSFSLTDCLNNYGCNAYADARGAFGTSGSNGTGGTITIYSSDADFTVAHNFYVGTAGHGGGTNFYGGPAISGSGAGGTITVESRAGQNGSGVLTLGTLSASSDGDAFPQTEGTSFNNGQGGGGSGGTVNVIASGGTFTANSIDISAFGEGGPSDANCPECAGGGSNPFKAGTGQGGTATFLMDGGTANITTLKISADGRGGLANAIRDPASVAAIAGDGRGGTAMLEARSGTLNVTDLTISAAGRGGTGDSYTSETDGLTGGAGFGGTARLLMDDGSTAQVNSNTILISASGAGGDGTGPYSDSGISYAAGAGGTGRGGTAEMIFAGGTLRTPSLQLSANGVGGQGSDNDTGGDGGDGGNGVGGTVSFSFRHEEPNNAIGSVTVQANGNGGVAGEPRYLTSFDYDTGIGTYDYTDGDSGAGGSGSGGNATMTIDVDPAFTDLTISADGIGSAGGLGGSNGADGGAGIGGIATLNLNFGLTTVSNSLRVTASALGGAGGDGLAGFGGDGGRAQAGTATVNVSGISAILDVNDMGVLADATGGRGGFGGSSSGPGLGGADGGYAEAGTALVSISDSGTLLTGSEFLISASATGGAGTVGTAGTVGGRGGDGGHSQGGSATLSITDGRIGFGSFFNGGSDAYLITADAQGGAGGNGSAGTGTGATGGDGGNGGDGQAGSAGFAALNGDFALGDINILADGTGGAGGDGGTGPGFPGNPSATPPTFPTGPITSATGGVGSAIGGSVSFLNDDDGTIANGVTRSIGNLTMSGSARLPVCCGGYAGGRVEFTDNSTATGGGLVINGSLLLNNNGFPNDIQSGLYLNINANPVTVGGNVDLYTDGPMALAFTNGGALSVNGSLYGYSGSSIDITHMGRAATADSISAQFFRLASQFDLNAQQGTSLRSGQNMELRSFQTNVSAAQLIAVDAIAVEARADVKIGNASVTGAVSLAPGDTVPSGGSISLSAGSDFDGSYDPATLTLEGLVSATGSISGISGADIVVASGASLLSDNRIELEAGDDIIVQNGASVLAARNAIGPVGSANILDDPALLYLSAGNGVRMANNPGAASILVDGTIGAAGRSVILSAEAIQADANPIASRNLYAYILRAPALGASITPDDSGTRALCAQGNICLGTLNATDVVRIGPLSGAIDLPNRVTLSGDVTGRDVSVRALDTLSFGNSLALSGSEQLRLESIGGNLILAGGSTVTGGQDAHLIAGRNIQAADVRVLTGGAAEVAAGGSVTTSDITAGTDAVVTAATGNLTVGDVSGRNSVLLRSIATSPVATLRAGNVSSRDGSVVIASSGSVTAGDISARTTATVTASRGNLTVGNVTAGGAVLLSSNATNFVATLRAGDVNSSGALVEIVSSGSVEAGNIDAVTDAVVTANNDGSLTVGNVRAGDDIWLSSYGTNPNATLTAGTVTSTGAGSDTAASSALIFGQYPNSAGPTGAVIRVRGQGNVTLGDVSSPGRTLLVSDLRNISAGDLRGGQGLFLFAQNDISAGKVITNGAFYVANQSMFLPNLPQAYDGASLVGLTPVKTGGSLSLSGSVLAGDITVATSGDLTFAQAVSGRTIGLYSNGAVRGDVISGSGPLTISGLAGISAVTLGSGGATTLTATNGAINVTSNLQSTGGVSAVARAVNIRSSDALRLAQATATAGDIVLDIDDDLTIGQASASNALRITAQGTARFNGVSVARSITVASRDIVIAPPSQTQGVTSGGRIGIQGITENLLLSSNNVFRPTFIGGEDTTAGYSLSAAEMLRLASNNIGITGNEVEEQQSASVGSTRSPDLFVRAFTLTAGSNNPVTGASGGVLGPNGTLTISTPGKMRVEGAVQINGLSSQGGLSLRGDDALEIIAGSGSIDLRDNNGALSGLLTLASDDVIAATLSAIRDVGAATSLDEAEKRLAVNDGVISDDGILRAGTIRANVINGFYVQNMGSGTGFSARRGFTANAMEINTEGSGTRIAINGRLLSGLTSSIATGIQVTPLVSINGHLGGLVTDYATGSRINGCLIASPGSCIVTTGFDTNDSIDRVVDPTVAVGRIFSLGLIELRDFVAQGYPPLIDEPVTGAGNDDLWDRQCDANDAGCGAN